MNRRFGKKTAIALAARTVLIGMSLSLALPVGDLSAARPGSVPELPATDGQSHGPVGRLRIPALGIDRNVYDWGCRGGKLPNKVYRWTCSGENNTFLLGHAASVFQPLYRAAHRHNLTKGMTLKYSTATDVEHTYQLVYHAVIPLRRFWPPLPRYYWLFNSSSPPVVTLVTCYGPHDRSRLVARFALVR